MLWNQITDKFGSSYLTTDSNYDNYYSFLTKYDSNGNLNWNKKLTNNSTECLVFDSNGNIFISGTFGGSYNIDGFQLTSNPNDQDVAYFGKIDTTLSVENADKPYIQIYPNPTKKILNITVDKNSSFNISIYDINGKKIITKKDLFSKTSLDISTFEKGIYIIELENEKGKISKKIIKN